MKLKIFFFLASFLCLFVIVNTAAVQCGKRAEGFKKVVTHGDRVRSPEIHPWFVQVISQLDVDNWRVCGGTLVSGEYILTAAHCLANVHSIQLSFGSLFRSNPGPKVIHRPGHIHAVHPYFAQLTDDFYINDIAVLRVSTLDFGPTILPICLPDVMTIPYQPNQHGIILGHGKPHPDATNSDELLRGIMVTDLPLQCDLKLPAVFAGTAMCLSSQSHSACSGDDGGPFLTERDQDKGLVVLAGIISDVSGCRLIGGRTIVVNVTHMLSWIHEHTVPSESYCGITPGFKTSIAYPDREVKPYEHPWFVTLYLDNKSDDLCGGSLISNEHILTSSNCIANHKKIKAALGSIYREPKTSQGAVFREVTVLASHPAFERNKPGVDIAILKMDFVKYTRKIFPICLPIKGFLHKSIATILGMGEDEQFTLPTRLQASEVKIVKPYKCKELIPVSTAWQMCVKSKSTSFCHGDNGGPLIIMEPRGPHNEESAVLYGIASKLSNPNCRPDNPRTYTNVTFALNWIFQMLETHRCGIATGFGESVYNGEEVKQNEQPWFVRLSIEHKGGHRYDCGGSLLSDLYILTSARCVSDAGKIAAQLGSIYLSNRHPDAIIAKLKVDDLHVITHPKFQTEVGYDIAVLKMNDPVPISPLIFPICLPTPEDHFNLRYGTVLGFGQTKRVGNNRTYTDVLRKGKILIYSHRDCIKKYTKDKVHAISESEMCGKGRKAAFCRKDTGGPLIAEKLVDDIRIKVVVGVASSSVDGECDPDNLPQLYANVTFVLFWIRTAMGNAPIVYEG